MRTLDRDRSWVLISLFEKRIEGTNAYGQLTGETKVVRSRQIPLLATVSAAKGSAEGSQFGQNLDYDRTVIIDDPNLEIDESAVLWIGNDVYRALYDGGYFERYSVYESGSDLDGGNFHDYESGDTADGGDFEYPVFSDKPHNYVVKRVAKTKHYTVLAVKHVEVSK